MKTFVFQNFNSKLLKSSSSGGVFYAIASYVIKNNGAVYGAVINQYTGEVYHKRAQNIENIFDMMGSKYVFSNLKNTFKECKNDLINNKMVLFSGTPCQINLLYKFLGKVAKNNLICLDFICHGCPLPQYWESYLKHANVKFPLNVSFRDKRKGWEKFSIVINGKREIYYENLYMKSFLKNEILMPKCFDCDSKGENRSSDITIGDAWGHQNFAYSNSNSNGLSLVIIRNKIVLLSKILSECGRIREVLFDEALVTNTPYFQSPTMPLDYNLKNDWNYFESHNKDSVNKFSIKKNVALFLMNLIEFLSLPKTTNKIGIISDFAYSNFGNKLQNYAMQKSIEKLGYKTFLITNHLYRRFRLSFFDKHLGCHNNAIRNNSIYNVSVSIHKQPFFFKPKENLVKKINKSKAIIFGSDQIWNYEYNFSNLPFHLGSFNGADVKVPFYSYAASAGVSTLDEKYIPYFKFYLPKFKAITVRENSLVTELYNIGFKSELVLDPTLLLSKDEWCVAINKYSKICIPRKGYVLKYCLGNTDQNFNSNIIDCLDKNSKFYNINQFDFINLIKNADCVLTDSYHCVIFSIIFGVKFIYKNRNDFNMSSRISTLKDIFKLRFSDNFSNQITNYQNYENYKKLYEKSFNYLKEICK